MGVFVSPSRLISSEGQKVYKLRWRLARIAKISSKQRQKNHTFMTVLLRRISWEIWAMRMKGDVFFFSFLLLWQEKGLPFGRTPVDSPLSLQPTPSSALLLSQFLLSLSSFPYVSSNKEEERHFPCEWRRCSKALFLAPFYTLVFIIFLPTSDTPGRKTKRWDLQEGGKQVGYALLSAASISSV